MTLTLTLRVRPIAYGEIARGDTEAKDKSNTTRLDLVKPTFEITSDDERATSKVDYPYGMLSAARAHLPLAQRRLRPDEVLSPVYQNCEMAFKASEFLYSADSHPVKRREEGTHGGGLIELNSASRSNRVEVSDMGDGTFMAEIVFRISTNVTSKRHGD